MRLNVLPPLYSGVTGNHCRWGSCLGADSGRFRRPAEDGDAIAQRQITTGCCGRNYCWWNDALCPRHSEQRDSERQPFLCLSPVEQVSAEDVYTPLVGPEVLAGSTRLKAGTATKLALNILSTGVMVQLGKDNRMVDVAVTKKLRDRALRILQDLTGLPRPAAASILEQSGNSVKLALLMYWTGLNREDAITFWQNIRVISGQLQPVLATLSADIHLRSRRFAETDPATSQYSLNPLLIRLIQAEIKHLLRVCSVCCTLAVRRQLPAAG